MPPDPTAHLESPDTRPLADVLAQRTAEIEASGLCNWKYADCGPFSRSRVISEVEDRCAAQDKQWGGPEHDDMHTRSQWIIGIELFIKKARYTSGDGPGLARYEDKLLDVAALAVQAIQSSRRKRNA